MGTCGKRNPTRDCEIRLSRQVKVRLLGSDRANHRQQVGRGSTAPRIADGPQEGRATLILAREALRPPVASLPSGWAIRRPPAPQRPMSLAPWTPRQAVAPDTTTRSVPAPSTQTTPWRPTVRRLDARQRHSTLDWKSGEPCSPDTLSVRLSRPTPRRKAIRLSTLDQACAAWIDASVRRWTRAHEVRGR